METGRNLTMVLWMVVLSAALVVTACSGKVDLQKQMSGVWEDRLSHEVVELRLSGDAKAVTVAGTPYAAEVAAMDPEKGQIRLTVETEDGKNETWILSQMWEDSDRFNIVFERGEDKEVLIPRKRG